MAEKITKAVFEQKIQNDEKVVIIDFYADWCGPCKMLAPILDEVSEENKDVEIYKVNVDEESDLARQFGVASIPTVVSFKSGKEHKRVIGVRDKDSLIEELV